MSDFEQIWEILSKANVFATAEKGSQGSLISIVGADCCRFGTCDGDGEHANLGDDQLKTVMAFDQNGKLTSVGTYEV